MKYADEVFYTEVYCNMQDGKIPPEAFPFWARKAETMLNRITCGNITEPTEAVKLCVCEIAELMYADEKAGNISSENNDGYSVAYVKQKPQPVRICDIVRTYLAGTGLLYRGYEK
jgi:hypothetical protein